MNKARGSEEKFMNADANASEVLSGRVKGNGGGTEDSRRNTPVDGRTEQIVKDYKGFRHRWRHCEMFSFQCFRQEIRATRFCFRQGIRAWHFRQELGLLI